MSTLTLQTTKVSRLSFTRAVGLVLAGTFILTISAYIRVPMIPVPITMQTLAVTLIGAFYGSRLGALTIFAWLLEGLAGLPVFAGGMAGVGYAMGATGGYLLSYPVVAFVAGWAVARGWNGKRPVAAFVALLLASGICLFLGWAWLAHLMGASKAFMVGVLPFIIGDIVKTAMATLALVTWQKFGFKGRA